MILTLPLQDLIHTVETPIHMITTTDTTRQTDYPLPRGILMTDGFLMTEMTDYHHPGTPMTDTSPLDTPLEPTPMPMTDTHHLVQQQQTHMSVPHQIITVDTGRQELSSVFTLI